MPDLTQSPAPALHLAAVPHTLQGHPAWPVVARVLGAALQAVDPYQAVRRALAGCDLQRYARVWVVGVGKAGAPMARAAAEILGPRLNGGVMIVKDGHLDPPELRPARITFYEAAHPVPDERSILATRSLLALLEQVQPGDLVLGLISGGGSALLFDPAPGVTLAGLRSVTRRLLASGASIDEMNAVRKHLDGAKGGGLLRHAPQADWLTLILSDVVGDRLDVIASGPTAADLTTYAQALEVLERAQRDQTADEDPDFAAIRRHLQNGAHGQVPETPKPGSPQLERVQNVIIASNRQAAQAARQAAEDAGFSARLLTSYLQGEARQAGRFLGAIARQMALTGDPLPRPACLITGGETTVTLGPTPGQGGRNQELALAAVNELDGLRDTALITLATDGGDGPTDAAGAVVTGESLQRALSLALAPNDFLRRNDAYPFFDSLGDLLRTGPTQTNVNDLAFLFTFNNGSTGLNGNL